MTIDSNIFDYKTIYENSFRNTHYNNHNDEEYRFQIVKDYVNKNEIKKIIDIGSGRGNVIKILQELNDEIQITSTDVVKFHNFNCEFYELNLCDPTTYIKDKKFELLICLDVLEHIQKECIGNVFEFFSTISDNFILTIANHSDIQNGLELHVIQEDMNYWKPILEKYFEIEHFDIKYDGKLYLLILKKIKNLQ